MVGTKSADSGSKIRVMVAAEEPVLAFGANWLLGSAGGFEVTRSPASMADLLPLLREERPDMLVLDLCPSVTPALFRLAAEAAPGCRLVLWTRGISDELAFQAGQYGIAGVLPKSARPEDMVAQLRRCAQGLGALHQAPQAEATSIALTPRESQVVNLLSQGLKNKEIAACLGLAESTIKSYLGHLFRKIGARDRFELAVVGLKNTYCGQAFWDGQNGFVTGRDEDRARPVLKSLLLIEPSRRRGYPDRAKAAGAR